MFLSELEVEPGAWWKFDYAECFDIDIETVKQRDHVHRVDALTVSEAEFIEKYETKNYPTVISNSQVEWLANKKWTKEVCALEKKERKGGEKTPKTCWYPSAKTQQSEKSQSMSLVICA